MGESRMFLDWCPLPERVWQVEPGARSVLVPWLPGGRRLRTDQVDLHRAIYPMPDGSTLSQAWGWHEPTRTLVMGPIETAAW